MRTLFTDINMLIILLMLFLLNKEMKESNRHGGNSIGHIGVFFCQVATQLILQFFSCFRTKITDSVMLLI
jgi:hypothetical protein